MKKILLLLLALPLRFIFLFSKLITREKKLVLFGVHTNSFSGNIKALLLSSKSSEFESIFIANTRELENKGAILGVKCFYKYSLKGIYYSLRAGTYIYSGFPSDINFYLSNGAKYINVWHGTPIKKIEKDVTTGYYSLRNRYPILFKVLVPHLFVKPDVLLVSSEYEEKCFSSAFAMEKESLVRAFPPRLESLLEDTTSNNKEKNILYVPTWRDDHSFSFTEYVELNSFNLFLQENSMKFYIKLHPSDKSLNISDDYSNIIIINKNEDVYNYLKDTDVLVSDYSSMVFESLYLLKPVILFCPDYENYKKNSREFYIDPCNDLPVQIAFTQEEFTYKLLEDTKIDSDKLKEFVPYDKEEELLAKLIKKAHEVK